MSVTGSTFSCRFMRARLAGFPRRRRAGDRGARGGQRHRAVGIEIGRRQARGLLELRLGAGQDVRRRLGHGTRRGRDRDLLVHLELEALVAARAGGLGLRRPSPVRRPRARAAAATFGEQRIRGVELAAQRNGLLPHVALAVGHGIELGGDGLEGGRLVVLRVDLEKLEVDLLALRVLLERVLEDFLGLRIAAVREIDLGFGDRVDLVGVDVAETLAAEVARERVVAGVDDAAAGRAEHRVGLDVGARDDAVLELRRLAAACGEQRDETGDEPERDAHEQPRSACWSMMSSKKPGGSFAGGLGRRLRGGVVALGGSVAALGGSATFGGSGRLRRLGVAFGGSATLGGSVAAFGGSTTFGGSVTALGGSTTLGGSARPWAAPRPWAAAWCTGGAVVIGAAVGGGALPLSDCVCSCAMRLVAQLHRALHVLQHLLELGDAAVRLAQARRPAPRSFPQRPRPCQCPPPSTRAADRRSAARPACVPERSCRCGRPPRASRLSSAVGAAAGDAVAIRAPIACLNLHDLGRLARRARRRLDRVRDRDDRARAQAVHVVAFERARIALEHRDQHLVERDRLGLVLRGDLRQRVAALDFIGVAFAARRGRSARQRGCRGRGCRARRRDGRRGLRLSARGGCRTRAHRGDRLDGRGLRARRIEQERVVANDAARRPSSLRPADRDTAR